MITKYKFTTPEVDLIDEAIRDLQIQRERLLAKSAKKKASDLCKEMQARKK